MYLDVLVDLECSDHEINKTKVPQSIQECCGDLKILSFKQILDDHSTFGSKYDKVYKSEKYCKLCGKSLLHRETYITKELIFCSDCYLIFTERIESSLVKKEISIFYIPRWHTAYNCLDDSLLNNIILCDNLAKFENIVNKLDKYYMHVDILDALFGKNIIIPIRWIPYSQFKDVKEMTKGGYEGLEHIHKNKFIHRDFHSGNMLFDLNISAGKNYQWKIGDLGLSQEINNESSNNEIYGIIPYIAPEIFKGSSFSKKSDIYSLGMVMWELTTGCKPFDNVKHDHNLIYNILDGERPKITEDTPECYANLMKSCWNPDPTKRPSIKDIRLTFGRWTFKSKNKAEFIQAETKRMELIQSKKLGPEFAEKRHSEAIYISRPLSALISKCLSTNSSSISIGNKKDSNYIYVSEEQELDIDIESSSSQNLSLKIQSTSSSFKKRNIEELNLETDDNSGKRIKTS
ncbi:kinase-like domain-containing protein [Rhizophagus irregularis DAOM 181602=DAOM 197198]|nr:kinase-like domain-containing protein [Rhizophagus irregularis DAOM 181602=DAOM 197198]